MSEESSLTNASLLKLLKLIGVVLLGGVVFVGSQFGVLLLVVIGGRLFGASGADVDSWLSDTSYWPKLGIYALITCATIALSMFILRTIWFKEGKSKQVIDYLKLKPHRYSFGQIVEVVGTYGIYFLCTAVVSVLVSALGIVDLSQPQELGIEQPRQFTDLISIFVMLVILPPIGEEVLFRGFLFNSLNRYSSVIVSGIITSVLFGLAHMQFSDSGPAWNAVLDTMIFSGFLIYIMRRHNSIYSSMLLHGLKNGVAFLILFGLDWL
jgi:membrane protease YdiL (CAAX protease family)